MFQDESDPWGHENCPSSSGSLAVRNEDGSGFPVLPVDVFPAHRVELFRPQSCVHQTEDDMPNLGIALFCYRKELTFLFWGDDMIPVILPSEQLDRTYRINYVPLDSEPQCAAHYSKGTVHI
jgi:hypothetical protein